MSKQKVTHSTDQEIITKVLAGKTAAYSVLVDKYKNMVFTLAYHIVSNKEDAEEVAQDAFVKAFNSLKSFREQSAFATWLYRIVVNTALNKKKIRKWLIVNAETENERGEKYEDDFLLERFDNKEQRKFIQQALHSLKEEERICLILFYLNEFSINEIHEMTNISTSNIKVILHRGRKHLYERLQKLLQSELKNLI